MCAIFTTNICAAPGEVEIIAVSQQKVMQQKYFIAEWKVLKVAYIPTIEITYAYPTSRSPCQ